MNWLSRHLLWCFPHSSFHIILLFPTLFLYPQNELVSQWGLFIKLTCSLKSKQACYIFLLSCLFLCFFCFNMIKQEGTHFLSLDRADWMVTSAGIRTYFHLLFIFFHLLTLSVYHALTVFVRRASVSTHFHTHKEKGNKVCWSFEFSLDLNTKLCGSCRLTFCFHCSSKS